MFVSAAHTGMPGAGQSRLSTAFKAQLSTIMQETKKQRWKISMCCRFTETNTKAKKRTNKHKVPLDHVIYPNLSSLIWCSAPDPDPKSKSNWAGVPQDLHIHNRTTTSGETSTRCMWRHELVVFTLSTLYIGKKFRCYESAGFPNCPIKSSPPHDVLKESSNQKA